VRGLLLDRDGVINENREEYVTRLEQFRFVPGALEALVDAARSPFSIAVVTNQSAIGRGRMSHHTLDDIHRWMSDQVYARGGRIDEVYVCPHHPDDGCACRKPRPGLLREAARCLDLDLEHSYFVGDSETDVLAALAAGCRPILVLSGHGLMASFELARRGVPAEMYDVVPDLRAAVRSVIDDEAARNEQPVELLAMPVA
jgi:D-glycero-D-manno-heptose 1,7-bisphosphate phosphatase